MFEVKHVVLHVERDNQRSTIWLSGKIERREEKVEDFDLNGEYTGYYWESYPYVGCQCLIRSTLAEVLDELGYSDDAKDYPRFKLIDTYFAKALAELVDGLEAKGWTVLRGALSFGKKGLVNFESLKRPEHWSADYLVVKASESNIQYLAQTLGIAGSRLSTFRGVVQEIMVVIGKSTSIRISNLFEGMVGPGCREYWAFKPYMRS